MYDMSSNSTRSLVDLFKLYVCVVLLLSTDESRLLSLCCATRLAAKKYQVQRRGTLGLKSHRIFKVTTTAVSRLNMNPQDYENNSRSSGQINFLLTKAVNLINMMTSKKKPKVYVEGESETEIIAARQSTVRIPVKFSFSSTHKHSIPLQDPVAAVDYLSLPVEAYSVLDSNLVSRSLIADDTFILSLPLGDLTSASQIATGGTTGVKLAATLRTEVTVRPDPQKGRVVMESGPIYFTPTKSETAGTSFSSSSASKAIDGSGDFTDATPTDETKVEVPMEFSDALPEWLLWGGRTSTASNGMEDDNNVIVINNDTDKSFEEPLESAGKLNGKDRNEDFVKSSVQAKFRIELQWKPVQVSDDKKENGLVSFVSKANNMRKSLFSRENIASDEVETNIKVVEQSDDSSFVSNSMDGSFSNSDNRESMNGNPLDSNNHLNGISQSSESSKSPVNVINDDGKTNDDMIIMLLPVTAVVKVWVDVNLPVRNDLSSALSFPPVNLLLTQAGSLTTKAVLGTLAPVLGTLLVRDYDSRRNKMNNTSTTDDQSSKYERKENIYDSLTADIEIK